MKFIAVAALFAAAASALPGAVPAPAPGTVAVKARAPAPAPKTADQLAAQGCNVDVCLETLAGLGITCVISELAGCIATGLLVDNSLGEYCSGCI